MNAPFDAGAYAPADPDTLAENLPPWLTELPVWLCWKLAHRPPKPKPDKVPFYASGEPRRGTLDTPEDRARLVTFETALAAFRGGDYAGLGVALGDLGDGRCLQAADIDNPALVWLADSAGGYVERSPSRQGVHVLGIGQGFAALGANRSGVEAYSKARFLTVTGEAMRPNAEAADIAAWIEATLVPVHGEGRPAQHAPSAEPERPLGVLGWALTEPELRDAVAAIPADDRVRWVAMAHALKTAGERAWPLFDQWSRSCPEKYHGADVRRVWESCQPVNTGLGAVFAEAQRCGWIGREARDVEAGDAPTRRKSKFKVEDFDTVEPPDVPARVKDLWPKVGVCEVAGASRAGKSFFAVDCLTQVCRGQPVLGRRSIACGCVYFCAEGAAGGRKRLKGLRMQIGPLGGRLKFIGQPPDLRNAEDIADLRATVIEIKQEMAARGIELGVVAIDTLSATIPGADENAAKDMSPVLALLQALAIELELLVLLVAHTGKDEAKGPRGWSGLVGNVDGVILLDDPKGGDLRSGTVHKVKDGRAGDAFAFLLKVVSLGQDKDGDEVTTCLVEWQEAPERPRPGRPPVEAEAAAVIILRAFERIFEAVAKPVAAPGAYGAQGVPIVDLRRQAFELGLGPSEPDPQDLSGPDGKQELRKWRDARRKAFDRALDLILSRKRHRQEGGWFWEIPKSGARP